MMDPNPPSTPKTSGSAIASLVCGLLGCIPFVTGLAAIILGIVGIRKTSDPRFSGKGLAIAGLILGVLSVVGWTGFAGATGFGLYFVFKVAEPARQTAEEFTRDLSEGKVDAALALSAEGTDRAALATLAEEMKPWGTFQSLGMTTVDMKPNNGVTQILIGGPAMFGNSSKTYSMTVNQVGTVHKVAKFEFH